MGISVTGQTSSSISVSTSYSPGDAYAVRFYIDGTTDGDLVYASSSATHTYSGLSSGTSYTLSARWVDGSFNELAYYSTTGTTDSEDTAPTMECLHDSSNTTDSQIGVYLKYSDSGSIVYNLDYIDLYADGVYKRTISNDNDAYYSGYTAVTSLSASTTYTVEGQFYDTSGGLIGTRSFSATTDDSTTTTEYPPDIPIIIQPSDGMTTTATSDILFKATVDDQNLDNVKIVVDISTVSDFSTIYETLNSTYVSAGSDASVTSGSLNFDTYYWRVKAVDETGRSSSYTTTRTFTVEKTRPSNWAWSFTVSAGSDVLLTADEWISFLVRINDFRYYKNLSDYAFTNTMVSGDDIMASFFNEAINAISEMSPPTAPPTLKQGTSDVTDNSTADDLTAYDFDLIRDSLNSIQ